MEDGSTVDYDILIVQGYCFYRAKVYIAEELLPGGQRMTFLYIHKDEKSHADRHKPIAIYT